MAAKPGDITKLLGQIEEGESEAQSAKSRLADQIYGELKTISHRRLRHVWRGVSLHTTMLVQEAWIRVVERQQPPQLKNRRYLFGAFAKAMQRIIIERRRKRRINPVHDNPDREEAPNPDVLGTFIRGEIDEKMDEILREFEREHAFEYEVLMLRLYLDFAQIEIADELGVPRSKVERALKFAAADLKVRLHRKDA